LVRSLVAALRVHDIAGRLWIIEIDRIREHAADRDPLDPESG
jgi:hypothetical protein